MSRESELARCEAYHCDNIKCRKCNDEGIVEQVAKTIEGDDISTIVEHRWYSACPECELGIALFLSFLRSANNAIPMPVIESKVQAMELKLNDIN